VRKRRDGGERWPTAAAGGERRRDSPVTQIQGSGARFEARVASTRRARASEANRGGRCGREAAERALDAAERRRKSGDGSKALQSTGSMSSGTWELLTSLRSSGTASRGRSDTGGGEQRRRRSRVPAGSGGGAQGRLGFGLAGPGGGGGLE
jgi:hypothetical protein